MVRADLIKCVQAGQTASAYAHEAWMQVEQLGVDVMSIGRLVGFVDRDNQPMSRVWQSAKALDHAVDKVV